MLFSNADVTHGLVLEILKINFEMTSLNVKIILFCSMLNNNKYGTRLTFNCKTRSYWTFAPTMLHNSRFKSLQDLRFTYFSGSRLGRRWESSRRRSAPPAAAAAAATAADV